MADRKQISEAWERGDSTMDIAYRLGVSQTTVYAELRRGMTEETYPNGDRHRYDPERGAEVYAANIKLRGNRTPRRAEG